MNVKNVILGFVFLGLMGGLLFAITGANVGTATQSRWNAAVTASSVTTTGGNITAVNINTSALTSKWVSFSGNLTNTVVLGSPTSYVFAWTNTTGGEVCITTNSSYVFSGLGNATTGGIDSAFSTTGNADDADGTFTTSCSTMSVGGNTLTGFIAAQTQGSSSFKTCAANSTGAAAVNHVFCTNVNDTGTNYAGGTVDYELIAPYNPTSSSVAYYFYAELS